MEVGSIDPRIDGRAEWWDPVYKLHYWVTLADGRLVVFRNRKTGGSYISEGIRYKAILAGSDTNGEGVWSLEQLPIGLAV